MAYDLLYYVHGTKKKYYLCLVIHQNLYPLFPYVLPFHNYRSVLLVSKNQASTLHTYIGCTVPQSVDFMHQCHRTVGPNPQ